MTRSEYSQGSCSHSTKEIDLSPGKYSIHIDGRRNKNLNFIFRLMISASTPGVSFDSLATNMDHCYKPNEIVPVPVSFTPIKEYI